MSLIVDDLVMVWIQALHARECKVLHIQLFHIHWYITRIARASSFPLLITSNHMEERVLSVSIVKLLRLQVVVEEASVIF